MVEIKHCYCINKQTLSPENISRIIICVETCFKHKYWALANLGVLTGTGFRQSGILLGSYKDFYSLEC